MNKTLTLATVLVLMTVITVVALGAWMNLPGPLPPQPIAFNHRLHLERVQGIDCQACHQFVKTQPYAGLPSKVLCFGCHDAEPDEDDTEADAFKPRFADLMRFAKTDHDIPGHRVTTTREDVFFSHRRHVVAAAIDCRTCHPRMPDCTEPPTRGPIQMCMDTCLDCHEATRASLDCISCHR